jgi:Protein of unknown function (DUF3800)
MPKPTELNASPDCLLVFLDETGHERMPKGHTYYGIGGCAVLMRDYEKLVRSPWCAFRHLVTGDPNAHLHAYEFGRDATQNQLEAFGSFFRTNNFMRVGAVGAVTTKLPEGNHYKEALANIHEEEHLAWTVLRALPNRILDVAKWSPFRSLALIFERNPRSKNLLQSVFSDLGFEEDGIPLPVELFEMSKDAGEPGLEVADFVANTIAGHARRLLVEGQSGFRRDFQAVFQSVGPKLSSFMGINAVEFTPSVPHSDVRKGS